MQYAACSIIHHYPCSLLPKVTPRLLPRFLNPTVMIKEFPYSSTRSNKIFNLVFV